MASTQPLNPHPILMTPMTMKNTLFMLRIAFERRKLALHYQPIIDLRSNTVFAVEALVRWPEREDIGSTELIGLIEAAGLSLPFGAMLLQSACRQAKAWQDQGIKPLTVAVNLTAGQFWQPDFADQIRETLAQTGLTARDLMLEIEEPALVGEVKAVHQVLAGLHRVGVQLAVDDFGAGYSSLNQLKRFPLSALKLSRTFLHDVVDNPNDAAITSAVIALAHSLGLRVIAVGAETASQLSFIREHQCDAAQSHYFAPALAVAEATVWLQRADALAPLPFSADRTVLILNDDEAVITWLSALLTRDGYAVISARTAEQALGELVQRPVDVLLADDTLPGMNGVNFLRRVRAIYPTTVRILLSGQTDVSVVAEAINEGGVFQFLPKSVSDVRLLQAVRDGFALRAGARVMQGLAQTPLAPKAVA